MAEKRNELTRVQLPAIIHLTRLGYKYFGKISEESAGTVFDADTNILRQVFIEQFAKLNPDNAGEAEQMLVTIKQELDNFLVTLFSSGSQAIASESSQAR